MPHDKKVSCFSFSPDGTKIVTASDDQTSKLWVLPLDEESLQWRAFITLLDIYLHNLKEGEALTYQGFMALDYIAQNDENVLKPLKQFMEHPYLRALLPGAPEDLDAPPY